MVLCVFVSIINTHSFCASTISKETAQSCVLLSEPSDIVPCLWSDAMSDPMLSLQTALVSRHHDTYPACADDPFIWISTFISIIRLICFRCVYCNYFQFLGFFHFCWIFILLLCLFSMCFPCVCPVMTTTVKQLKVNMLPSSFLSVSTF